ncbi:hypothetical protein OUZ56_026040 [Daphnia magna]|uniref:Uncharacterized protein n=1 Tax=Daphnia magna TaxID=35525 RepID=A0ABQ9ZKN3_9CRUS|nr:hypothetical protein OUZ56_026040 [Daphnia magna]
MHICLPTVIGVTQIGFRVEIFSPCLTRRLWRLYENNTAEKLFTLSQMFYNTPPQHTRRFAHQIRPAYPLWQIGYPDRPWATIFDDNPRVTRVFENRGRVLSIRINLFSVSDANHYCRCNTY